MGYPGTHGVVDPRPSRPLADRPVAGTEGAANVLRAIVVAMTGGDDSPADVNI